MDYDEIIDDMFEGTNAVGTTEIGPAFGLAYAQALAWAETLGVAKIGASFAWTREDAEALADELDDGSGDDDSDDDDDTDDDDSDDDDDDDDDDSDDDDDDE
jgi:hypothetical protein